MVVGGGSDGGGGEGRVRVEGIGCFICTVSYRGSVSKNNVRQNTNKSAFGKT